MCQRAIQSSTDSLQLLLLTAAILRTLFLKRLDTEGTYRINKK